MLPYPSMNFTAFDILTAAEMNQLVDNIESLSDGSGLAAGAVKKSNIDFSSGIWWEEIGRQTLGSNANTLTATLTSSKNYLKIIVAIPGQTGNTTTALRFNGDTGNNYSLRAQTDGGAEGTSTSVSSIGITAGSVFPHITYADVEIVNISSRTKVVQARTTLGGGNATTIPTRRFTDGTWANTSVQISSVTLFDSSGTSQFNTGTQLIVLGRD